jgi:hypothetical protein
VRQFRLTLECYESGEQYDHDAEGCGHPSTHEKLSEECNAMTSEGEDNGGALGETGIWGTTEGKLP